MADANVDNLIRSINRLVVDDTGGVSLATGDQLPGVTRSNRRIIEPLADNLDIPARVASVRPGNPWPELRSALTEVVAGCASTLAPEEALPSVADDFPRTQFTTAVARAYAALATPRLMQRLLPQGGAETLGLDPQPPLTYDTVAARTIAIGISGRTGAGEDEILTEMAGAGRGAAGLAGARLLMRSRPGFVQLSDADQRAIVERVAADLESGFGESSDRDPDAGRQRRADIDRGADTVDLASETGDRELVLRLRHAAVPVVPSPVVERPESVHELMLRVQGAVGELTGAAESQWNGKLQQELGQAPDTTLRLTREQAMALGKLLESSETRPLDPADASAAREALQVAASSYARWASSAEYDHRHEAAAQAVAPRFAAIEHAVGTAFAEDNVTAIADRSLSAELADQVRRAAPPEPDPQHAPAARGFASAVDTALDRQPGETLRQMAGEGRARMALVAAEALVADSAVENVERPFAVRLITEEIDRTFDELPVEDPHRHGRQTAKVAESMAEVYGDDPGTARREAAAADRAQADNPLRFVPGHDPATTSARTTSAPASASAAVQNSTSLRPESRERDR